MKLEFFLKKSLLSDLNLSYDLYKVKLSNDKTKQICLQESFLNRDYISNKLKN